MKKIVSFSILVLMFISCNKTTLKSIEIKGKVHTEGVNKVEFKYIVSDPIHTSGNEYIALIDENNEFSISIPLSEIGFGRIQVGRYTYEICLMPNDNFNIEINKDSFCYVGNGAEKNNFLIEIHKNKLSDNDFYNISRDTKLSLKAYSEKINAEMNRRLAFLNTYSEKNELSDNFRKFYNSHTINIANAAMINYHRKYTYKNKENISTLALPSLYQKLFSLSNLLDDSKAYSGLYLKNVSYVVYTKAGSGIIDYNIVKKNAQTLIVDSLSTKTKEYILLRQVYNAQKYSNYKDTVGLAMLKELKIDKFTTSIIDELEKKENYKKSLINNPLPEKYKETELVDSNGIVHSLGKILEQNYESVIYLDIWSMSCSPCREAMPYSKQLKEKLKNRPIQFIYLSSRKIKDGKWDSVYKTTFSKENHYYLKDGLNSVLFSDLDISFVPCYMIFDKQNNLVNLCADRPTPSLKGEKTPIEEELRRWIDKK